VVLCLKILDKNFVGTIILRFFAYKSKVSFSTKNGSAKSPFYTKNLPECRRALLCTISTYTFTQIFVIFWEMHKYERNNCATTFTTMILMDSCCIMIWQLQLWTGWLPALQGSTRLQSLIRTIVNLLLCNYFYNKVHVASLVVSFRWRGLWMFFRYWG
jgi:hypothetical protein